MKSVAIILFVLAGLSTLGAINTVFIEAGGNRPEGAENVVGYAAGAFLLPMGLLIAGLVLLRKANDNHKNDA